MITPLETGTDIESFVNSFWEIDPEVIRAQDDFNNILLNGQTEGAIKRYHERDVKFKEFLKTRFGKRAIDELTRLETKLAVADGSEREYHLINSHAFRTGLCEYNPPSTSLRGKATLLSILEKLSCEESPITLIDLGSGDGKIDIGLAFSDKIKQIYAIDSNPESFYRMSMNLSKLPKDKKDKISKKIVKIRADYRDINKANKHVADIVLFTFPFQDFSNAVKIAREYIGKKGAIITYYPFDTTSLPGSFSLVKDSIEE